MLTGYEIELIERAGDTTAKTGSEKEKVMDINALKSLFGD